MAAHRRVDVVAILAHAAVAAALFAIFAIAMAGYIALIPHIGPALPAAIAAGVITGGLFAMIGLFLFALNRTGRILAGLGIRRRSVRSGGTRATGSDSATRVEVDDAGLRHIRPDGTVESIAWREVQAVAIETTSDGPLMEDAFWKIVGDRTGCIVPNNASGMQDLISALFRHCPGLDAEQLVRAMGSTANANFVLWMSDDWKRRRAEHKGDP